MLKKDELADKNSCLNKAADDEMVFVLRANDESAPSLVRVWASKYKDRKGGYSNMTLEQLTKYRNALRIANEMEEWKMDQEEAKKGGK